MKTRHQLLAVAIAMMCASCATQQDSETAYEHDLECQNLRLAYQYSELQSEKEEVVATMQDIDCTGLITDAEKLRRDHAMRQLPDRRTGVPPGTVPRELR